MNTISSDGVFCFSSQSIGEGFFFLPMNVLIFRQAALVIPLSGSFIYFNVTIIQKP